MSSQSRSQLLSALRFFELIDDAGKPQQMLYDLAYKDGERKVLIKQLIETYYPDIVALDFSKITPTQLENALASNRYNVAGDTRKKAKTFLLKAAQHAGYTVHPLLTKITRNRRREGGRRAGAGSTAPDASSDNEGAATPPTPTRQDEPEGAQKTIQLRRGGSLSLSLSVNLWELKGEDRQFVFKLIDDIDAYEEGSKSSTEETNKVEKEAGE